MEHKTQWADIKQASKIMGVPDHVIRRACHKGQLSYKKIGRKMLIPMSELVHEIQMPEGHLEEVERRVLLE